MKCFFHICDKSLQIQADRQVGETSVSILHLLTFKSGVSFSVCVCVCVCVCVEGGETESLGKRSKRGKGGGGGGGGGKGGGGGEGGEGRGGRRRRRRRRRRSGVELLPERLRPPHLSPVKQHETLSALMCRLSPCLCLYLNRRVVGFVCVTQPGSARP